MVQDFVKETSEMIRDMLHVPSDILPISWPIKGIICRVPYVCLPVCVKDQCQNVIFQIDPCSDVSKLNSDKTATGIVNGIHVNLHKCDGISVLGMDFLRSVGGELVMNYKTNDVYITKV